MDFTLAINSIDLEADYPDLAINYPTSLEFVVEMQLDGFSDVIAQTNVTITVNFTSLIEAIDAAILVVEEAEAAAEAIRIAEEEAAAAALAAK